MKRMQLGSLLILMLIMVCILPAISFGEDEKPEVSVDVAFLSKYIWRGYALSDDSIVIQPSVDVSYKGFGFNMWSNYDTEVDGTDDGELNETDLTLSYGIDYGPLALEVGYIYYGLDTLDDSEEFYLSAGVDIPLSPTLAVYREVADAQGWYFNAGISHSINLTGDISLDMAASAGYYLSDDDGFTKVNSTHKYKEFHDGLISVSLTIPIDKYITLSPKIAYSFGLTNDADDRIKAGSLEADSDYFFGGINFTMAF